MQRLQQVKPAQIFVACDGPRSGDQSLAEACRKTRQVIEKGITWPCDVQRFYRNEQRGCRRGVGEAINWFFSHVESGIIIEDDVLPGLSFFPYCAELLQRYRDDSRVGMISGCAIHNEPPRDGSSYHFSRFCHVWGWASWRRAWLGYDSEMLSWPEIKRLGWLGDLGGKRFARYWSYQFDRVWRGECDTWDYIWMLSCWQQGQSCIVPAVNLVDNLGFNDPRATHTAFDLSPLSCATQIDLPLRHPTHYFVDARMDRIDLLFYYAPSLHRRFLRRLKREARRLWQA